MKNRVPKIYRERGDKYEILQLMLQEENRKKTETRMTNNLVARKYFKKKIRTI